MQRTKNQMLKWLKSPKKYEYFKFLPSFADLEIVKLVQNTIGVKYYCPHREVETAKVVHSNSSIK